MNDSSNQCAIIFQKKRKELWTSCYKMIISRRIVFSNELKTKLEKLSRSRESPEPFILKYLTLVHLYLLYTSFNVQYGKAAAASIHPLLCFLLFLYIPLLVKNYLTQNGSVCCNRKSRSHENFDKIQGPQFVKMNKLGKELVFLQTENRKF